MRAMLLPPWMLAEAGAMRLVKGPARALGQAASKAQVLQAPAIGPVP